MNFFNMSILKFSTRSWLQQAWNGVSFNSIGLDSILIKKEFDDDHKGFELEVSLSKASTSLCVFD